MYKFVCCQLAAGHHYCLSVKKIVDLVIQNPDSDSILKIITALILCAFCTVCCNTGVAGYCGSMQSVLNDISVVWRVFSLPVLEPMTRGRLQKIVAITMSCLYASLSATMATSVVAMATASTQLRTGTGCKDEEIDGYASNIVIKSVMIFTS